MQTTVQDQPSGTLSTSIIHLDDEGTVRFAVGEFAAFGRREESPRDALREYLGTFRSLDGKATTENPEIVNTCLKRWLDPASPAFVAETKDGSARLLSSSFGDPSGLFLVSTDMGDQARDIALSRMAADNNPMPLWVNVPETGEIIYHNAAASRLFHVPDPDRKYSVADFLNQDDVNRDMLHQFRDEGRIDNLAVHAKTYDGEDLWVVESAVTAEFEGRTVAVGAIQDLTEQRKVDRETRMALDLLRDAIESLAEGFALYDEDRCLVMCNTKYKEMNSAVADLLEPGIDWEIVMRESAKRGVYADAVGRERQWVSDRLETTHHYAKDFELEHTDGSWYAVSTHPTKFGGFAVTRSDITQKKNAELMQRDGDNLVRRVLETSPLPVVMARLGSGEIVYRSPAAQELFGRVDNAKDLYEDTASRADYITELLGEGRVDEFQVTLRNGNGDLFPALLNGRLAEYNGDEVVVTTTVDLTSQMEAEAAIRRVVEACPVPIQMTVAETGQVLIASPETKALFGSTEKAASYYARPGERDRYIAELREKGHVMNRKAEFIRADGSTFWGAVSARMISFNGADVIVSNTRDLTDEIALQEELDRQRDHVFQNEKMSAMGELLAGVAHELNNPLSIVVGHSLMMREEISDEDTLRRIDKISSAAERCSKIVKTFLAMARQQPARMELIDIGSVVNTAVDVAGYGKAQEQIKIKSDISPLLPEIIADSDQITQVIINLVLNAGQAISQSGKGNEIMVSARHLAGKNQIEIIVSDNGPGIPEAIRARIFEPFFTTKNIGDGTGIGLAFCHRIIHSHGGAIWIDPDYTKGSAFHITLPIGDDSGSDSDAASEAEKADINSKILVVDDESDVAGFIAEVLMKDGYQVDVASSGAEAVQMLKHREYDALVSDLNMPDVDGRALYEVLESFYPELALRTAFITGDTMGTASQQMLRDAGRPFLEKPVSPNDLRQLVSDLLNTREDNNE